MGERHFNAAEFGDETKKRLARILVRIESALMENVGAEQANQKLNKLSAEILALFPGGSCPEPFFRLATLLALENFPFDQSQVRNRDFADRIADAMAEAAKTIGDEI